MLRRSLLLVRALIKAALCDDVVVDIQGNAVLSGADYYMMLPFEGPDGGEFAPGKTSNMTCPLSVVLDPASGGELVRISSTSAKKGIVSTEEAVDVSFANKIKCAESSKWMIVRERGEDFWSVVISSARDHPGSEILSGSFKIQKSNVMGGYKFIFCPNATVCGNIQGSDRLVLIFGSDSAFNFVLRPKASLGS
ncbi:kunitz-type serine protease inhibitor DrTI-like [Neltuma alba]|uniref:kunitz-type serine protease inhibitor DrTI-like n=1 Tax=Neltuma alba TaxID=207710 RepID=UPI0010A3FA1D|nr:kunitz-type serine protease inhibitor DrTI-like [Prosopis alba]